MILSMLDKKIKGKKQNIIKKLSFYYIIRANYIENISMQQ